RDSIDDKVKVTQLATRLRKGRRLRASRTHGWGTSGQHRGTGMQGGAGISGRYRHKRSRLIRTGEFAHMHYKGKKGFTPVSASKDPGRTMDLWQLSGLVDKLVAEKNGQFHRALQANCKVLPRH